MTLVSLTVMSGSALSGSAKASVEGVSSLSYAPLPFHSTSKAIRVRFTTVGRAPPGRVYAAWIFTGLGNPDCYNEVNYRGPPIKGAPGTSYTVAIRANAIDSDAVFCKGRARLHVSTELVMHDSVDGPRRHTLRVLRFRIL